MNKALTSLDAFMFAGADREESEQLSPEASKGKVASKAKKSSHTPRPQKESGDVETCTPPKKKARKLRQAAETTTSNGHVLVQVLCSQCRKDNLNHRQLSLGEIMNKTIDLASEEEPCDRQAAQDTTICQRCRRSLVVENMSVNKKKSVGAAGCPFSLRLKQYKRNAVETCAEWQLTDSDALSLMRAPCALCGIPADPQGGRPNGITRRRSVEEAHGMGPYCSSNVATACSACNLIKGIHTLEESAKICSTIATHRGLGDFGCFPEVIRNNISKRSRSCYLGDTARKSTKGTSASKTHSLSNEEFNGIVSNPCHFCGKASDPPNHYNGLDRLNNSLRVYTMENSVSCCGTCNMAKGKCTEDFFLQQCVRIASFPQAEPAGESERAPLVTEMLQASSDLGSAEIILDSQ